MAQLDQQPANATHEGATNPADDALKLFNNSAKNIQAIVGEIFDISKESYEHTLQAMAKLREAKGLEEVMTIQTNYVRENYELAIRHTQKFSELFKLFPAEIAKNCQDAWLKSVENTVKATETASEASLATIDRFSDAARKAG
ncbi:MAG: phasin family protein [Alphaproteobacteria bacterium]|nr:phasin family protein [Alphaproteobacteria bacterium]